MQDLHQKLESVLIANRGEIACRIIRSARARGMRTIAVYSEADADAQFVRLADEAYLIGPAAAAESYLRIDRIIDVALRSKATSIHPGYGFLSERAEFAAACASNDIVFIGPPASAIEAMGLKGAAKALMQQAGVPVVPGYHGDGQDAETLRRHADAIGYPVLIKAVAGGGGKGMRRVDAGEDFQAALESAQREAQKAFGNSQVLIEKYVLAPRHIEFQVFADRYGNVVHLFERDCSMQRRHQKVIEEAPAPGMTAELRAAMGHAAVEAARAVGYVGAGTVEFIADGRDGLREDRFYFMEMNTRLQVEHPVTEAITGLDLVDLQFEVASGSALPFAQEDIAINGHAVEARLYAEDPENLFLPSTGKLWRLEFPTEAGLRVDSGVIAGDTVTANYDPMIAKVIAHGNSRDEALDRLASALGATVVAGPKTNLAFLQRLCLSETFRSPTFDTGFIDSHLVELGAVPVAADSASVAQGLLQLLEDRANQSDRRALVQGAPVHSPWHERDGFQLLGTRRQSYPIQTDGTRLDATLVWQNGAPALEMDGEIIAGDGEIVETDTGIFVVRACRQVRIAEFDPLDVDIEHLDSTGVIKAPMHGQLAALLVAVGDLVSKNQKLLVVEAMKMEHALFAPSDGYVEHVAAAVGDQVSAGDLLITLGTAPA